jgi:hypothetical protein
MDQIMRELVRQVAGVALAPEQLQGLVTGTAMYISSLPRAATL